MKVVKVALKAGVLFSMLGTSVYAQNLADAKKAIDAEQYDQAKVILQKLVASQPTNAENYFYLGNIYIRNNYIDSAKAVYSKGIAVNAQEAANYAGLGTVDLMSKNQASAKTNFDKAISFAKKKDNDPYIFVATSYLLAANPYLQAAKPNYEAATPLLQAALPLLEKAASMDPKDAAAQLALGDVYRGLRKTSEAYSAYRTAYDLDKNLLRAKIELGVITKLAKAYKESVDEFNSVLALNANYAPAYRELAETYLLWSFGAKDAEKQERLTQALNYYKKYLDLTDRSLDSRMRYADFLVYAADYKALEQEAQAMAKQAAVNPRIYRYLAISSYENGNYPGSVQAMKDFMSKVDQSRLIPFDYLYLGKAQLKTNDSQNGIANLTKAVDLDSTYAEEMSTLGSEFFKEKKYAEAAALYTLASKGPNAVLGDHFYAGYASYFDYTSKLAAKQNPSKELLVKADSAFSYVNKNSPSYLAGYMYRARANRYLDNDQNPKGLAVPHYEKYLEVVNEKPENLTDPKNKKDLSEAYNYLGAFYLKSSPSKAKEYFSKSLSLDPSNSYANDALKSLGGGR